MVLELVGFRHGPVSSARCQYPVYPVRYYWVRRWATISGLARYTEVRGFVIRQHKQWKISVHPAFPAAQAVGVTQLVWAIPADGFTGRSSGGERQTLR